MSIKIGNQKYKFTPQREIEYKKFIDHIKQDGGELVNPSIGYDRYLREGLVHGQVPIGRKEGKVYTLDGDLTVVRNGGSVELTKDGVYHEVPANVPVFDWSNGFPELVVGDTTTNLIERSWDFSEIYWDKNDSSVEISGYEYLSKPTYKYTQDLNRFPRLTVRYNFQNESLYTFSFYVRDTYNSPNVGILSGTTKSARFNLNTNEITYQNNGVGKIEDVIGGYKKISLTFMSEIESQILYLRIFNNDNSVGFGKSVEVSNCQLIQGTETKHTPVLTNGQAVTRPAEIVTDSQGNQLPIGRYATI